MGSAQEGADRGLIARVWNVADSQNFATLALPASGIGLARSTTHIETDLDLMALTNAELPMSLARQQLRTFRLFPTGTAGTEPPVVKPGAALSIRPNPVRANGGVAIAFESSRAGRARVTVLDVRGARVATLFDGRLEAGRHEVRWDEGARRVPPGLYFVKLESEDGTFTGRIARLD